MNDLVKRIKKLESNVLGYKTFQPIGGNSVRTFTTMTNKQWDLEGVTTADFEGSTTGQIGARIRFKADNQQAPFARIRFFAEINGQRYDYSTSGNEKLNTSTPAVTVQDDWYGQNRQEILDTSLVRFTCVASALNGTTIKIKFAVDATDTGTLYLIGQEGQVA